MSSPNSSKVSRWRCPVDATVIPAANAARKRLAFVTSARARTSRPMATALSASYFPAAWKKRDCSILIAR